MITICLIDSEGYFVEDQVLDDGVLFDSNQIVEPVPEGLIRPRWTGAQWVEGATPEEVAFKSGEETFPDWEGLYSRLRSSTVFQKSFSTSSANGWALLLTTLGTTHNEQDLRFALSQVRAGLTVDFTAEDLSWINQKLEEHHFSLRLS